MPTLPTPTQTDAAIQNQATGVIDYLKFTGTTLTGTSLKDYGIAGFKVVGSGNFNGDGNPDLVVQNAAGFVDLLFLNASASLIGSALTTVPLPRIAGVGVFNAGGAAAVNTLVGQLANGQLDFIQLSSTGAVTGTDLVPNSIGLPTAVGVAEANDVGLFPAFFGVGTNGANGNDNVITQLANGQIDVIGFSGGFGTLSVSATNLLSQSIGVPTVGDVNPDFRFGASATLLHENVLTAAGGTQGVQMIGTTASGQLDALYFNSGYPGPDATEGAFYASSLLGFSLSSGFQLVSGGSIASATIFPIT